MQIPRSFCVLGALLSLVAAEETVTVVGGYCCPKSVTSARTSGQFTVNRVGHIDVRGDLFCEYATPRNEYCNYDGWCEYPLEDRVDFKTQNTIKKGVLYDYRCGKCSQTVSNVRDGNVPCSSSICCPSAVFGPLKDAYFLNEKKFRCDYSDGRGCEYDIQTGKLTFTYYHGACPPEATMGGKCVINGTP